MKHSNFLFALAIAAVQLATNASATTITSLNGYSFSSICESITSDPNTGCSVANASGSGTVQFSLNGPNGPSVTASNSSTNAGGNTFGDLVYQILVNGPTNTAQVDVNFLLNVSGQYTSPLGNDQAASINTGADLVVGPYTIGAPSIQVTAFGGSVENGFPPTLTDNSVGASYASGAWNGSLAGPQTITLTTGLAYNIDLRVQANCQGQGTGDSAISCMTSASADPVFTIDPGQINANQYSILLSPGIGNGSVAPEPSTVLLFSAGMIGLALARRGR